MSPIVIAITLFILALVIGVAVIGRVPTTLHTPLMSGANSIHGVVVVGVILVAASSDTLLGNIIIFFAALLGTMNVVGGYVVTDRMLEMFKPKKEDKTYGYDVDYAQNVQLDVLSAQNMSQEKINTDSTSGFKGLDLTIEEPISNSNLK